jgi:hypothetical protein
MDRRNALKKLGMGGATVVGATMIVSSPAFAFAKPQNIDPPSLSFSTVPSTNAVRYLFDSGSAACTSSSTGPTETSSFSGTFSGTAGSKIRVGSTGGGSPIILNLSGSGTVVDGFTLRFEKLSTADDSAVPYVAGDSISYTLTTTWTCTYDNSAPDPATTTQAQGVTSGTISYNGTSWTP